MSAIRNVIFDWSGTLVDDLPAVLEATNHVFRMAGLDPLSADEFRDEFQLPFTGFYRRYLPNIPAEQLEEWFHGKFRQVCDTVDPLPHAETFLKFCRSRQLRTFVLSTVSQEHFDRQVERVGFRPYLDRPYLGIWDKREKIVDLLSENGLEASETLFIGDMEHDVETAKHGGVHSAAVLTGYNRHQPLVAAGPDLLVEHLGELQAVLERNELRIDGPLDGAGRLATTDVRAARYPIATVGGLIFNDRGEVLMIRTQKWSDRWGIPGGKIEWGESSEQALRREILEETALEVEDIRFVMVQDCIRSKEFYREEHFLLLNYTCRKGCEGDAGLNVELNEEAQAYRWVRLEEALAMELNRPTRLLIEAVVRGDDREPRAADEVQA